MSTRDRPKADGSAMRARGPEANPGQMRNKNCRATNKQTKQTTNKTNVLSHISKHNIQIQIKLAKRH